MTNFIQMSISAAVLILIVMVIRKLFIHKLPKLTFNTLWAVVVLRLIIPFSFSISIPNFIGILDYSSTEGTSYSLQNAETDNLDAASETVLTSNTVTGAIQSKQITSEKLTPETIIDYNAIMKIVWFCGGIALAMYFITIHFIYRRNYKMSVPLENELIKNKLSSFNLIRKITIKTNDMLFAPITYGVVNPVILLPKTLNYTDEHFDFILSHEIIHIKRFDVIFKWVMTAALCLHWFNPLVWLMYVLSNRDIELACDESVVRQYNGARTEYAKTLILLEEKRSIPPFVNGFGGNSIRERIISIMKIKKSSLISTIAAVIIVASSFTVFTSAAVRKISPTENDNTSKSSGTTYIQSEETSAVNNTSTSNATTYTTASASASSNVVENAVIYSDSTLDIEYNKKLYSVYGEYGIKYDKKTNKLYYKEKIIKYFIDEKNYIYYYDKDGTISFKATYNINKLNGVKQIKNSEAKKIADDFKNDTAVTSIAYGGTEFIFDEDFLSLYSDFGITVDYETNCYNYKDKLIAGFCDRGTWVMVNGGARENGGIYLSVNRKDGEIVNFSIVTEEKFSELSGLAFGY